MHISSYPMSVVHFYWYMTKKKKIKAWCSHQSELICNALPILLTSTEVMHSKNKEAIDDSTSYNGNKKLMHQNTTYITYFSLNKSSNSLIYCIVNFWLHWSQWILEQRSLSDVFLQTPKPDLGANIQDGFNFRQMIDQLHGITQIEFVESGS